MNRFRYLVLAGACAAPLLLGGCVAAVATGAAAGASMIHDRRTAGTVIEDKGIELKAANDLYEDKAVWDKCHINVTSYNEVVLVTGEAPTEALREQVIEKIRAIPKVRHIYNEIAISAPSSFISRSSDTLITAKVKTALFEIKDFDPTRVKVVTERGVVYLMGLVTRQEGDLATNAARRVGGVQKVVKMFEYIDTQPAGSGSAGSG